MQLRAELTQFTNAGKKVYVYGASTKGNTMLQLWDIGNYFEGAAEIHPDKIGRFTVGTNIPIVSEQEARENADVFFVPNFGFRDMFVKKERKWLEKGGRMIFAMPRVEVI
jgi:ABC-type Fe3+-hydroxamate transport system substrate-binding protein